MTDVKRPKKEKEVHVVTLIQILHKHTPHKLASNSGVVVMVAGGGPKWSILRDFYAILKSSRILETSFADPTTLKKYVEIT